ncbi:MAG: aminotransferase class III-fold pyridoxal phosphate-dependent enzyme, partial [Selenomonadales bacterium]|nr:aminotransferase class III-fold pyridoxal phosphate-dependent enzyme [Selenomonadales bacterium]
VVPPYGYLREIRALCDRCGALMIADEVQTGMGRTGRAFAVEREDVVPDILVLAKALGGGVMPCGAFIATEDVWRPYFDHPFLHTSTFGGNPLACVAADMAMTVLIEEGLAENAANMGEYLLKRLQGLMAEYPDLIRDVRGRGLLIGMELSSEGHAGLMMSELIKRGVVVAYTLNNPTIIRLEPPLIIQRKEVDMVIDRLGDALLRMKKYGI